MKKRTLAFTCMAVVAGLLMGVPLLSQGGVMPAGAQEQTTAQVERRTLGTTIETTGTIAPVDSVLLSFGTSGTVREVLVDVGDEVEAGAVLARLDTSALENQIARQQQALIVQQTSYDALVAEPTASEIAQAQSNLTSAQSQLEQAQNNLSSASNSSTINCASVETTSDALRRAQDAYADYIHDGYNMDAAFIPDTSSDAGEALRDAQSDYNVAVAQCNQTTPDTQYQAAVTAAQASLGQSQAALDELLSGATAEDIASAQAQLEQARLELEDARAALSDVEIVAPFSGVVSEVDVTVGQLVNTATTVITLVDTSALHIDVSVDELDIAAVEVGQPARINPEALDNVTLEGTVTRIAPTSTTEDGIVTFQVRVDISQETNAPIRIGMTTDVEIVVGSVEDALVVPTEAIQREGTNEFVEVQNADSTTTRVFVTSGQTIEGLTVVTGDLTPGVTVIIPEQIAQPSGSGLPFGGG